MTVPFDAPPMSLTSPLQAEKLCVTYGRRPVLSGLDIAFPREQVTAIVGPNGCGKSTLLSALARLHTPQAGRITLERRDIRSYGARELARALALLPQNVTAPEGLTAAELIRFGRQPHQSLFKQWSRDDRRVVDEALAAGIKDLILVTAEGENLISRYLEHAEALEVVLRERGKELELRSITDGLPPPGSLTCVVQSEPLGLGHAVWCAKELIDEQPFAVILPDDLVQADPGCLAQMVAAYGKTGGNVVAVENVPREQTARYGVLDVEMEYGRLARARGLVEKPDPVEAPSTLSIIGRYILQPEVLGYLDRQEFGAGNEIQLTDAMAKTIGKIPFHGLRFQGRRFDCGNKIGFLKATMSFALAREDMRDDVRQLIHEFADGEAAQ